MQGLKTASMDQAIDDALEGESAILDAWSVLLEHDLLDQGAHGPVQLNGSGRKVVDAVLFLYECGLLELQRVIEVA